MATSSPAFHELLRRHRRSARLTQEELAARAGISVYSISNMERGIPHIPRADTLRLLATALQLSPTETSGFIAAARAGETEPAAVPHHASRSLTPLPVKPLIGRQTEHTFLDALLRQAETRLVTITGTAGVGKTSLVLVAAQALHACFADGVQFISLAACANDEEVEHAIARALDVQERSGGTLEQRICTALQTKQMLLVLDNFEHVIAAAPFVAMLLATCPHVKVLLTSRVRLHVQGEHVLALAPLAVPDLAALPSPAELQQVPAVALFVQHMQAHRSTFVLTEHDAPTIAALCVRLDGLPLALELAAARCRLYSPAEMLARLDDRFAVLVRGPRDLPERQQSLRAALQWSYELLDPQEQVLFRRLGIFANGATLAAIETICAQPPLHETAVDAVVEQLLDHSLVQREDGAEATRITMLETPCAFAAEHLRDAGEATQMRDAHLRYFLALAETAAPELRGPQQHLWQNRLGEDLANVYAALEWALSQRMCESSLRFAGALWRFWYQRGMLSEGSAWLERILALPVPPECQHWHAQALHGAG